VVFAGDRSPPTTSARIRAMAPGATVVNGYGATETPQLQAIHVVPNDVSAAPSRCDRPRRLAPRSMS